MIKILKLVTLLLCSNVWAFDFTIIHTNDLHSYVGGLGPDALFTAKTNDKDPVFGHYSRLSYQIGLTKEKLKNKKEPFILMDAGDFYAGTVFQILGPNEKTPVMPELEFFLYNEYDFSTIGNHEFDAKDAGFYHMLNKVNTKKKNFKILASNLKFNNPNSRWKKFYQTYNGQEHDSLITDIYLKELEGQDKKLKVGVIGILGPDGAKVSISNRSDASFIGMNDKKVKIEAQKLYKHLQSYVDILRGKYKADVVIITMHAGNPEDKEIAENVNGVDVIIAGHTHELYEVPRHVNNTIITQVKCYGNYLGVLPLRWNGKHVELQNNQPTYKLIDDTVPTDPEYSKLVAKYVNEINKQMEFYDYEYNTPIFKTDVSLMRKDGESHNQLGLMVTSAIKKQFNLSKKEDEEPIDLYFTTMGMVRADLKAPAKETPYQFSDTFKFLPLGTSEDGRPGFPIVTFYLKKKEIRLLINFLEIYKYVSGDYTLVVSDDLTYKVNKWGVPMFNRIQDLKLRGLPFEKWPEYINLATTSYVASHIHQVGPMSYGLVSFTPTDKKGNEVKKPVMTQHKEFKLFSDYMKAQGRPVL